ncbi:MAG: HTTM domain-containing protein [Xanthomonadaceae bacterium]|nr:HTTM domain-containing protein [Xanthomonadaceae bacterium]
MNKQTHHLTEYWNRFFHDERQPINLDIFRILIGILIFYIFITLYPVLDSFYGLSGIAPLNVLKDYSGLGRINLFLVFPLDPYTLPVLYFSTLFFSLTLMIGLWSRFSSFAVFILMTSFHHRNIHILNSGDTLLRLFSFFMIFSPIGRAFSVDRIIRILKGTEGIEIPQAPIFGMRLLQFQFTWVYVCATFFKLKGSEWMAGTALSTVLKIPEFQTPLSHLMAHDNLFTRFLTWSSIGVEALLGTLIWIPRLRLPLVFIGIVFHLCIDQLMFIPLFEWIMITGLLLFVDNQYFLKLAALLKDKKPIEVLYDPDCTFCTRWMKVFCTLDLRQSICWTGSQEALTEAVYISSTGNRSGGFFAFRKIVLKLPTLWILIPFFFFPGSAWIGTRVYKWIADHRYVFM